MKKETLLEIILGTIGGLVFAIGMCMCLLPEWNMFTAGVITTIIGFIILLCIIPVYKSSHPKKAKENKPINWGIVLTWTVGRSTGTSKLVGIYSTFQKAQQAEQKYLKEQLFGDCSIDAIPLDKVVDITYLDW